MKKKNQKKTSWTLTDIFAVKSEDRKYSNKETVNISPYTLTGSGFNGKEISWKDRIVK